MSSTRNPTANSTRSTPPPALLPATLLALLAIGCASPGPPRPPSLKLPQLVTDLSAQRVGNQVILHWTTPTKTTDNLTIKDTITARICRNTAAAPTPTPIPAVAPNQRPASTNSQLPTPPCNSIQILPIHPGPSTFNDTLPAPLTADPVSVLDYRVEIDNATGHSAGLSNPAYAAAGAAPPPVAALRATPTETGVMLEWIPNLPATPTTAPQTSVELDRVDLTLSATRQLQTETTTNPSQQRLQVAGKESPEVHLRATPQPALNNQPANSNSQSTTNGQPATGPEANNQPEPSGTIDQTAHFGDLYRYTAQRVRSIDLAGHTLELRSAISAPVTIPLRDTFPPASPTGLDAIPSQSPNNQPSTANNQPSTTSSLSIDLSWQPNSEPDLAGYIVYRRQLPTTALNQQPTPNNQQPTTNRQPSTNQQQPANNQQQTAANQPAKAIRLTPTPILGSAFRDLTALPGQTYAYSITAIDTSGNESPPTPEVQQTVPKP